MLIVGYIYMVGEELLLRGLLTKVQLVVLEVHYALQQRDVIVLLCQDSLLLDKLIFCHVFGKDHRLAHVVYLCLICDHVIIITIRVVCLREQYLVE